MFCFSRVPCCISPIHQSIPLASRLESDDPDPFENNVSSAYLLLQLELVWGLRSFCQKFGASLLMDNRTAKGQAFSPHTCA